MFDRRRCVKAHLSTRFLGKRVLENVEQPIQPVAERVVANEVGPRRRGAFETFLVNVNPVLCDLSLVEGLHDPVVDVSLHVAKGVSDKPGLCIWATAFFLFAALSDILDGYLARKMNLVSDMGKFLDPLADKLLVISAIVMLVDLNRVPAWVALVIIGREISITALRSMAVTDGVIIAASSLGKTKTVLQNLRGEP